MRPGSGRHAASIAGHGGPGAGEQCGSYRSHAFPPADIRDSPHTLKRNSTISPVSTSASRTSDARAALGPSRSAGFYSARQIASSRGRRAARPRPVVRRADTARRTHGEGIRHRARPRRHVDHEGRAARPARRRRRGAAQRDARHRRRRRCALQRHAPRHLRAAVPVLALSGALAGFDHRAPCHRPRAPAASTRAVRPRCSCFCSPSAWVVIGAGPRRRRDARGLCAARFPHSERRHGHLMDDAGIDRHRDRVRGTADAHHRQRRPHETAAANELNALVRALGTAIASAFVSAIGTTLAGEAGGSAQPSWAAIAGIFLTDSVLSSVTLAFALVIARPGRKNQLTCGSSRDAGVSVATAYRYPHGGIDVIAAHAPDLTDVMDHGQFVCLDDTLISSTRSSARSEAGHDLWYSDKHKQHVGNIQVITDPTGYPVWVGEVEPGSTHDITAARAVPGRRPGAADADRHGAHRRENRNPRAHQGAQPPPRRADAKPPDQRVACTRRTHQRPTQTHLGGARTRHSRPLENRCRRRSRARPTPPSPASPVRKPRYTSLVTSSRRGVVRR